MLRQFVGDEVALGNLFLFLLQVACHLDEFHSVEQGTRDGVKTICCGDKEHMTEVIVDVKEIVVESAVLLGVKHLKQGGSGVSGMGVGTNLVYLIEHEDGVRSAHFSQRLDDSAGHGTDIGTPVSAYLCLIV